MKVVYNQKEKAKNNQKEKAKKLREKYPNDGVVQEGEKSQVNPDNFFKDMEIEEVRQRYIKFTVYIEALYEVLGLARMASMEEFAFRVRDIVYAANQPDGSDEAA